VKVPLRLLACLAGIAFFRQDKRRDHDEKIPWDEDVRNRPRQVSQLQKAPKKKLHPFRMAVFG
jgi:hypothetical protein